MRPRLAVTFLAVALFAITGCDLVTEPDGPRPEDFEFQEDTSQARATTETEEVNVVDDAKVPHDVAAPLATARGGVTLSMRAPR